MKLYNWGEVEAVLAGHGVSYRQFDYWVRGDKLGFAEAPNGSGNRRTIRWATVQRACAMGDLVGLGFTPNAAADIAAQLIAYPEYMLVRRELAMTIEIVLEKEPTDGNDA